VSYEKIDDVTQGASTIAKPIPTSIAAFSRENRDWIAKTAIGARVAEGHWITVPSVADRTVVLRVFGFPLSYRQKGVHP